MNIYCYECEKELEIKKDINTEIHVFGHVCEQDASLIAAMQARIEKLEAGIRRIINGEYDNARTIDAAEKFARELLRGDK